jgi:hypothetical protein
METISMTDSLQNSLQPLRKRLANHVLYRRIETLPDLKLFMEHHIFAVWDFMSLLKTLQRRLTCITAPWLPEGHRLTRRLINEIVLEEESDTDTSGGYISHFELYRSAMEQCGADTSRMDVFLAAIRHGNSIDFSLAHAQAPKAAQEFVKTTMRIVESESTHAIAAAFTLGREDVIPMMFQPLVAKLADHFHGELTRFQNYLDRHIKLDEQHHTPMALRMLVELCGDDLRKWKEAEDTARVALIARIALWDGVIDQISLAKGRQTLRDSGNPVPSSGHSPKPDSAITSAPFCEG